MKNTIPFLVITFLLSGVIVKNLHFPFASVALAISSNAERKDSGISELATVKPTVGELFPGQTHSYTITFDANQYRRIVVEFRGICASITLRDPDGQEFRQPNYCRSDPLIISAIAEAPGAYRLDVQSLESEEQARGQYTLCVEEARPATVRDKYRIAAEKAFAEGEQLQEESQAESTRLAVGKYKEAMSFRIAAGDERNEARTLKRIGDLYQPLGELQTALSYYYQALSLNKKIKDRWSEAETLREVCYVRLTLGENQKAMSICTQALKLSQVTDNQRSEAGIVNNIGEIYYGLGNSQRSLQFYQQALRLWQTLNDRHGQAVTLLNFGYTYSDLGQIKEAINSFQQALSLWRTVHDRRGQAITLTAIGRLHSRLGESQKALSFFNQAMELIELIGDPIEEARILNGIAYVHDLLGDKRSALKNYNNSLSLFRKAKNALGESNTLYDIGNVYYSLGDYAKALDCYQQDLSISQSTKDRREQSYALRGIGSVYDALGDKSKALDNYNKARSFYRDEKDLRGEADTLNLIARVYEAWNQDRKALNIYNQALTISRKAEYRFGEAASHYNTSRLERGRGNLLEARNHIEAAIRIIESLRTNVASHTLRTSYFASVCQHYELYIDVLMRLREQCPSDDFQAAAFEVSERARARSLIETLAGSRSNIRQGIDPALLERKRTLQQQLNAKAERRMQLLSVSHNEEAAAVADEIDDITCEFDAVEAQIRVTSPRYAALMQPQPLNLHAIQRQVLVDDDTLLLEYALGEERSYLWAVTRAEITSYVLPTREEIESTARLLYASLTARQPIEGETFESRQARVAKADAQYWQHSVALSRMILEPVAAKLKGKRLLIVADGALQYVPFGALTVEQFSNGGDSPLPLAIKHEIVHLPSASALAVVRRETAHRTVAAKAVAIFADPVFEQDDPRLNTKSQEKAITSKTTGAMPTGGYRVLRDANLMYAGNTIPRLPASESEADAIMEMIPADEGMKAVSFAANRQTAMSPDLAQYQVVHFATHGILDADRPELSGVALSLLNQHGEPQDGFLRMHDIYNLDLPIELVVLSACGTGLGKEVKGEGLIGLTRGFMYAGAKGVVASLWKVDDEATAELMKHFYRAMLKDNLSPAAALRQAQVAMWQQKRWRAPYFWAAFVLQGEYDMRIATHQYDGTRAHLNEIIAAAGAMIFLSLGGLHLARRRRNR